MAENDQSTGMIDRAPRGHKLRAGIGSLLEGSPQVAGLLARNPFPGPARRYVHAGLYRYRFASPAERRQGPWWRREILGPYAAVLSLEGPAGSETR
jgi:hypothetical protein